MYEWVKDDAGKTVWKLDAHGTPCRIRRYTYDGEDADMTIDKNARASGASPPTGDPSAQHAFSLAVASVLQRSPHLTRQQAVAVVRRRDPALHQAYLRAVNPHVRFEQQQ